MKTLYLSELYKPPKSGIYFVIGVKAPPPSDDPDDPFPDDSSLENFQSRFPTATIERFPEVVNPKYITSEYRDQHILQPAFVTFL